MFCGGAGCKHEDFHRHPNPAIPGLHSDWVTDDILATQRLSSRLIKRHALMDEFRRQDIRAVFNLQLPGEHPYCGDGLQTSSGFSYRPEELYEAGVAFYNPGWKDMQVPDMPHIVNTVQLMMSVLQTGAKVAVHCHAGFGRTGVAIACTQLYRHSHLTPDLAILQIRKHRPRCVQTKRQRAFVYSFYQFITQKRLIFPVYPLSVKGFLAGQDVILHGIEWKQRQFCPKIVEIVCSKVKSLPYAPNSLSNALLSSDSTLETRISAYKNDLNSAIWTEINGENSVFILIQLLFDWLETALLDPPFLFTSTISQLAAEIKEMPLVTYTGPIVSIITQGKFMILHKIAECILSLVWEERENERDAMFERVCVSLQGGKLRFRECFEGRRLVKVTEMMKKETEKAVELMKEWSRKVN